MAARPLRNLFYTGLAAVGLVLALSALVLLAKTSNNSEELARLSQLTLVINGAGIAILFVLLMGNIIRLIRDLRRSVPGARLKGRMVAAFVGLALLPLSVVYYFSLQFLNRGIDSWFSVQVEEGLSDALELSRAALEIQMRNGLIRTEAMARRLARGDDSDLLPRLADERRNCANRPPIRDPSVNNNRVARNYLKENGQNPPPLEGHGLQPGDAMTCEMFPQVWPRAA